MEEKKKRKGCGCLTAIVVIVVLGVIISAIGGGDNKSTDVGSEEPQTSETGNNEEYTTEFNPEYTVTCTDTSIVIDVEYNCPDGAVLQCVIVDGSLEESYSDTLPVEDEKVSFKFDLDNTDAKVYGGILSFQFNADSVQQPDNVKAVYGEYGENLSGENVDSATVEGHEDAQNGSITLTINYPNDEAVQAVKEEQWNEYASQVVSASNGMITQIIHPNDAVYNVYFTNSWYLLTDEQKEYMANTIWDGMQTAAKNIFGQDTIALNIYAGNTLVAESSILSGEMKMK